MNVLMIGPSRNSMGGIATVIKNFSMYFKDDNIKIFYFESWKEGSFLVRFLRTVFGNLNLIYSIKKYNIDIVHIHVAQKGSFYRKSIILFICKFLNVKTIFHIHGSHFDKFYNEGSMGLKKLITYVLNSCDKIIVLSEEWEVFINKITKKQVTVMHNAVYVESKSYNNKGKKITFLGRLGSRKGTYDLLSILDQIDLEKNGIKLYLCGDGDIDEVKNYLKKLHLKENVVVTGWIDNKEKEEILKDTIINILPSYHEGMPMAILETMSKGIPNISTNVGGITRVIKNFENGIVNNPGDNNALKNSINMLINDEKLRENLSNNAYSKIQREYSIDVYNKKIAGIYRDLMRG
ncbi:glycosyltransferase family 4 protein [Terrisporobacter glycolicus]|nr:glycosyltransferase family 4 protein [Terrisporobacter glycolicus]